MKYTNSMKLYLERIKQKHMTGFSHGQRGVYNPGHIWGGFQSAYERGYKEGQRLTVKTKK